MADFNNDELPDILVVDMLPRTRQSRVMMANNLNTNLQSAAAYMGYEPQYPRNTLQLNEGVALGINKFSEIGQYANISSSDWSWAPLFVDLNLDGFKDIFISNGYLKDITNQDFIAYRKNRSTFSSIKKIDSLYLALIQDLERVDANNLIFWNENDSTLSLEPTADGIRCFFYQTSRRRFQQISGCHSVRGQFHSCGTFAPCVFTEHPKTLSPNE